MTEPVTRDEHEQLDRAVRDLLRSRLPMSKVRAIAATPQGHDTALWREMVESMGLAGIAVPTDCGGAGGGIAELAIVCRALGAALAPTPYLASAVLAATLLVELASTAARELLEAVATGSVIATVGYLDRKGEPDLAGEQCSALRRQAGYVVSGVRAAVPYAGVAEVLLVPAQSGDVSGLFVVHLPASRASLTPLRSLDITARFATVELDGVPAVALSVGDGVAEAIERAYDKAIVCLAASQLGGMNQCVDETVSYVKTRRQFGRAVGSFQAVKHGCADMRTTLEVGQATTTSAITALTDDRALSTAAAELAAISCGEGYKEISSRRIQYMGGLGYTWEADAHLYYKRAWSDAVTLGGPRSHRSRLAQQLPELSYVVGTPSAFASPGVNDPY